ncbi:major facilitator superfamily protein [Kipferlia bialata]|uniref:Major facilitator superfamily protein n=1 Tax=Kipferlia bialata TaxID=797122 RepID=A0A9K3GHC9_9EUKA|nr:major facilitator superfamily protein [Kipferlia bialata]|eukprot:g5411.t1
MDFMAPVCRGLQDAFVDQIPDIDLNADKYLEPATNEEIKMVIEYMGDAAMKVTDVSEDLSAMASMWQSGYVSVLVTNFFGGLFLLLTYLFLGAEVYKRLLMEGKADKMGLLFAVFKASFNLVQFVACAMWHRLSERIGRKWCMMFAYIIYGLCFWGMAFWTTTFNGMLIWRALSGFAAIIHPLMNTIAADLAPLKQRATWLAFSYGSMVAGTVFSGVVMLVLTAIERNTFKEGTKLAAGGCVICAIACTMWKESAPLVRARQQGKVLQIEISDEKLEAKSFFTTAKRLFTNKRFVFVFTAYVLSLSSYCILADTASSWLLTASDFDGTTAQGRADQQAFLGLCTMVSCIVGSINTFGFSKVLAKKLGEKRMTFVGLTAMFIALNLRTPFGTPVSKWLHMLSVTLSLFCESLVHPAYVYLGAIYGGTHDRGSVLGSFQLGNSLGRSILSIVHGFIFDYSWRLSYSIAAVYPIVAAFLMYMCPFQLTRNNLDKEAQKQRNERKKQSMLAAVYRGTTSEASTAAIMAC